MSNQIVKALEHGAQKLGKTLAEDAGKALKGFYRKAGDNLKTVAKNVREVEEKHAKDLAKIMRGEGKEGVPHPRSGGGRHGRGGGSHPNGKGRDQVRSPHESGRQPFTICEGGEPVDMATGRMFMNQVDVELPGALPLLFTRSFESGYQAGQWMGPRWICLFDERLEIDDEGVVHLASDRTAQAYPHPEPGERVQSPAGTARRDLTFDPARGRYTLLDRSEGLAREFVVQPHGQAALLTCIRDRFGRSTDFAYDEDGTPLSISTSGGYRVLVTADAGRITALRLAAAAPDGHDALLVRYGYTDGHLTSVYDSVGKPARYVNDAAGRIVSWSDRNGTQYHYTYDQMDRVVDEGSSDGLLRFRFLYGDTDPATRNKVHSEIDAYGNTTRYHVNERAQITARIDPLGNTTLFERDEYDRLLAETDPLGRTTRYEYDGAGDLTAVTRPDGHRTTLSYTGTLSVPTEITYPGGATWRQTFDDKGRRTALTDPAGGITRYTWDEQGFPTSVTDPLGHTTRLRCNAAGLPIEVTDEAGAVTRYERDPFGRVTSVTDPLGAVSRYVWDTEGNLISRIQPGGQSESFSHDDEGNLLTYTNQLGQVSTFEYGPFSTLTARTAADGSRFTFTYDANLRITQVTNALGQHWTYTHDAAGRVVAECDFNGRAVHYDLDGVGQPSTITNPLGQHTRYTYDQLGNVIARDVDNRTTTFTYDIAGNLIRAANPDAELLRTVDALGNVVSESVNGRTVTCTWNALGQRLTRTTPSGHTSTFTYDPTGRTTDVTTPLGSISFTYDTAGREQQRAIAGQLTLDSAYDNHHQLIGEILRTRNHGRILNQRAYTYRTDGYLTAVQDTLSGTRTLNLDPVGRVTAVHAATWNETYTYDPAGNITHADWPATGAAKAATGNRTYQGTRLTAAGRVRYEHDAAGRTVLRQVTRLSKKPDTWHYTWDAEDRLTQVTTPDGTRWRYLYDPFGRRIAKQKLTADGSSVQEQTDFTWDGHTLAEQTAHAPYLPGPHTLTWDHKGAQPIAQSETITTPASNETEQDRIDRRFFAIVTDLVGTPTELVDPATDTIAWRATTTLWGNTTWPTDSTTYTPLRFPGQYFDPETRLHYNVYRYYDPETARYTSPDPLGLAPAPNPDTYVANPHSTSDPLGLAAVDENDVTWGGRVTYEPLDHLNRAKGVFAILDSTMMGGKTDPKYDPVGWATGKGYNRAHLLGAQIGGSNKDPRNFVTMHQYANTPIMRDLEGQIRKAVDAGEIIHYRVTPHYDRNELIPRGVTIEAYGNKGFQFQPKGSSSGTNTLSICNKKKK
ncbi:DUF6531 domain-containing protein [Kitasatospora cineracea]|uniref:DUF6531 domain-containing protein n=1 Tax=Kitasatospora cineracea TaxID=88074 RepID=UPI0036DC92EE